MADRPITELPAVYRKMAAWARDDDNKVVRDSTLALRKVVDTHGSRFHIRGKSGKPVTLGATSNVKVFGRGLIGRVSGHPAGFWHIVEKGRGGGYLVASRQTSTGGRRRGGQATLIRSFGNESLGGLKPISTPMGPRQWARPGPHGPIGKPWQTSMIRGDQVVAGIHTRNRSTTLARAFIS
jgi:hypothetical protein